VNAAGNGDFGRASRPHRSLPVGLGRFSGGFRVRSAARSLEGQSMEASVVSCGTAKAALSACWSACTLVRPNVSLFRVRPRQLTCLLQLSPKLLVLPSNLSQKLICSVIGGLRNCELLVGRLLQVGKALGLLVHQRTGHMCTGRQLYHCRRRRRWRWCKRCWRLSSALLRVHEHGISPHSSFF